MYIHVYVHLCRMTSMPPIFTWWCSDAYQPRLLWSPDFPLIQEGIPLLPSLLDEADMQLSYHLFHTLGLGPEETNCCRLLHLRSLLCWLLSGSPLTPVKLVDTLIIMKHLLSWSCHLPESNSQTQGADDARTQFDWCSSHGMAVHVWQMASLWAARGGCTLFSCFRAARLLGHHHRYPNFAPWPKTMKLQKKHVVFVCFCCLVVWLGMFCTTVFNLCASQVPIGPLGPSERGGCFDLHRSLAQVAGTQQFDVFVSANSSCDQGPGGGWATQLQHAFMPRRYITVFANWHMSWLAVSRLTTSGTSELSDGFCTQLNTCYRDVGSYKAGVRMWILLWCWYMGDLLFTSLNNTLTSWEIWHHIWVCVLYSNGIWWAFKQSNWSWVWCLNLTSHW